VGVVRVATAAVRVASAVVPVATAVVRVVIGNSISERLLTTLAFA
jgi:hypothetical protein